VDVVLFCSDLKRPEQFNSITETWIPETLQFRPTAVRILVGVTDSEDSRDKDLKITNGPEDNAERHELAKTIGALTYLECDVRTPDTVLNVFNEVCGAVAFTFQAIIAQHYYRRLLPSSSSDSGQGVFSRDRVARGSGFVDYCDRLLK
jgi:GTPase SAR1 family protein